MKAYAANNLLLFKPYAYVELNKGIILQYNVALLVLLYFICIFSVELQG